LNTKKQIVSKILSKNDSWNKSGTYRPVSSTSAIYKLLKRVLKDCLLDVLGKPNVPAWPSVSKISAIWCNHWHILKHCRYFLLNIYIYTPVCNYISWKSMFNINLHNDNSILKIIVWTVLDYGKIVIVQIRLCWMPHSIPYLGIIITPKYFIFFQMQTFVQKQCNGIKIKECITETVTWYRQVWSSDKRSLEVK